MEHHLKWAEENLAHLTTFICAMYYELDGIIPNLIAESPKFHKKYRTSVILSFLFCFLQSHPT